MNPPEVPAPDEITAPWWEATREHRLLVQTCVRCAGAQHPPRALCVHCGHDALGWSGSSGLGVVDSFTVVHRAPRPELEVPYVIARVRLAEGVILLTRLEGRDPGAWAIDDPVRATWVDLDDGRALPVFVPAGPSPTTEPEPAPEQRGS
ncbi:Zn-ribbon domain-containing OB-fold protein [Nonomuraea cavernae]|uniref:DUF35 domain-containing protein n=1 Tax=Nonomuraea cavernae TaxID=2045107 RepID=A0A917YUI9_9ACTN|nr:OB-fold domain-containing protein [Nonomuraea cavernae]MCA2185483.1 OB-fold domain-containing protein [Nonomuraea cavernae]GGO66611.1 hypothetical protein GCM10012289_21040 [Nonomuraea cavernae]